MARGNQKVCVSTIYLKKEITTKSSPRSAAHSFAVAGFLGDKFEIQQNLHTQRTLLVLLFFVYCMYALIHSVVFWLVNSEHVRVFAGYYIQCTCLWHPLRWYRGCTPGWQPPEWPPDGAQQNGNSNASKQIKLHGSMTFNYLKKI